MHAVAVIALVIEASQKIESPVIGRKRSASA
jgi:hypothetical protein